MLLLLLLLLLWMILAVLGGDNEDANMARQDGMARTCWSRSFYRHLFFVWLRSVRRHRGCRTNARYG